MALPIEAAGQAGKVSPGMSALPEVTPGHFMIQAVDLSGFEQHEIVIWRMGKQPFIPNAEGEPEPDLACITITAGMMGTHPKRGQDGRTSKRELDIGDYVRMLHNRGILRVDTVCGPPWEHSANPVEEARRKSAYCEKLKDPQILARLMLLGWSPTPDALPRFHEQVARARQGRFAFGQKVDDAFGAVAQSHKLWVERVRQACTLAVALADGKDIDVEIEAAASVKIQLDAHHEKVNAPQPAEIIAIEAARKELAEREAALAQRLADFERIAAEREAEAKKLAEQQPKPEPAVVKGKTVKEGT